MAEISRLVVVASFSVVTASAILVRQPTRRSAPSCLTVYTNLARCYAIARQTLYRAFNDIAFHRLTGDADDSKAVPINVHFPTAVLTAVCRRMDAAYFHPKTLDTALANICDCSVQRRMRGVP